MTEPPEEPSEITLDVSTVAIGEAAATAEGLAEAGEKELLLELAERLLPRLLKKERVDEIEGVWFACCAAGAVSLPLMLRVGERLVARGWATKASELLVMLSESLVEAERLEEALDVLQQALTWTRDGALLEAGAKVLATLFAGASNLDRVVRGLTLDQGAEALRHAERALRFSPGTFLRWSDHIIAQVVATDGVTAQVRHPSGAVERKAVDEEPPPRVVSARAHEVRRLFALDELRSDWKNAPTACLSSLLDEQGGVIAVPTLRGLLVPRVLDEPTFDAVLGKLKVHCGLGHDDRPSYDSRRRLFVAPGQKAPEPRPAASGPKPAPRRTTTGRGTPRGSSPTTTTDSSSDAAAVEGSRWVDLTLLPEIRRLIAHTEGDVAELTRELNVDLPQRLEEARAHGDLRENAEYDAAKERLRFVQARIGQLRDTLAQLHELSRVRLVPGRITAMSVVVVTNEETGEERTLRLVPSELREPRPGDVSIGTPYAKALIGREAGATVVVTLPRRTEKLEIVKVVDPDRAE
jgi:transcription elongation factor GreA